MKRHRINLLNPAATMVFGCLLDAREQIVQLKMVELEPLAARPVASQQRMRLMFRRECSRPSRDGGLVEPDRLKGASHENLPSALDRFVRNANFRVNVPAAYARQDVQKTSCGRMMMHLSSDTFKPWKSAIRTSVQSRRAQSLLALGCCSFTSTCRYAAPSRSQ